jgi:FK506-binding protein 1
MAAGPPLSPPVQQKQQQQKPPSTANGDSPRSRAGGVLGRKSSAPPPAAITPKTAADFIAEGVVDDVDFDGDGRDGNTSLERFMEQDIRFNVDDVKDPFKAGLPLRGEGGVAADERLQADPGAADPGDLVQVTGDGGVVKHVIQAGSGGPLPAGATVTVHYTGKLEDGSTFDSSEKREDGFAFVLGQGKVIKGWEAAIATMRLGEISELVISPAYAYGRRGMPPVIPGNATLTFEVQVISVQGGEDTANEGVQNVADFNTTIARSPSDISRDYELRLKSQEERRANMSLLERFYIISPFASQTGERPPWFLNPNITFFIVFLVVAAAFYLVVESGGVHTGYVKEPINVNIFTQ